MNNLLCHPGRIFTLDEIDGQAEAAPESMPRELTESLEDGKEDDDLGLTAGRAEGNPVGAFQPVSGPDDAVAAAPNSPSSPPGTRTRASTSRECLSISSKSTRPSPEHCSITANLVRMYFSVFCDALY
jgi:hypothetical protein